MTIPAHLLDSLTPLCLANPPVAIGFLTSPPAGLSRVDRPAAAACGYWKSASEGQSFYATAEDETNCAVGAYTHGVEMTPQLNKDLEGLVATMVELKYLKMVEVPGIPRRSAPFQIAAYAPLPQATFNPDVIVFRGNARQVMVLSEAARAAGVFDASTAMGRPACAMVPEVLASGHVVASLGCVGNRVYTGLADDELYLAVPAAKLEAVLEHVQATVAANVELEKFHTQRLQELA